MNNRSSEDPRWARLRPPATAGSPLTRRRFSRRHRNHPHRPGSHRLLREHPRRPGRGPTGQHHSGSFPANRCPDRQADSRHGMHLRRRVRRASLATRWPPLRQALHRPAVLFRGPIQPGSELAFDMQHRIERSQWLMASVVCSWHAAFHVFGADHTVPFVKQIEVIHPGPLRQARNDPPVGLAGGD